MNRPFLCKALLIQAINGEPRAAALLSAYRLGKPPDAMNPRELYPLARVPREPALSIGQVADMLQKTYENHHEGLMGAEEARINQALLTSMLEARKAGERDAKVSELLAILRGRPTMRSHRDLWKRVQRSLTSDSLGRTVAGLVLAEVDRLDLGSLPLWTDAEIEALKRPLVRDS